MLQTGGKEAAEEGKNTISKVHFAMQRGSVERFTEPRTKM